MAAGLWGWHEMRNCLFYWLPCCHSATQNRQFTQAHSELRRRRPLAGIRRQNLMPSNSFSVLTPFCARKVPIILTHRKTERNLLTISHLNRNLTKGIFRPQCNEIRHIPSFQGFLNTHHVDIKQLATKMAISSTFPTLYRHCAHDHHPPAGRITLIFIPAELNLNSPSMDKKPV